ncbi:MAG: type II secretion system F family protein [Bryobacteraceae bacterium]|nr:type II secretion system F family protein [Solibacteraceae bacterium]MCL4843896.1 type II secretion system F family protein [Bryobacteraceae bacterium]MCO5353422.1 type II secretion system F family protein [Bryobacteraceae bacterium]
MPEFALKYANARGEVRQQVMEAGSEQELRDKLTQQGYLVYSIRPREGLAGLRGGKRAKKLDMEKFLIFNQQFNTLFRAGLPILKSLDLLAERLTDKRLSPVIVEVRDEVKRGTLLSEAFRRQGVFPPIYVTSVMAGEKSGALGEVLDRYVNYQKLALAVRKKILLSLLYPSILIVLVALLVVFLVTFVVPRFATLYETTNAELPVLTRWLIAVGTSAQESIVIAGVALVGGIIGGRLYLKTEAGKTFSDRVKMKLPVVSEIWTKYQVAQIARLLSTLLTGGIPLVQGLETAAESIGSPVLRKALEKSRQMVREGQSLSSAFASTGVAPPLAVDMMEVGESTGALPAMLSSVAEFYEDDVNTRMQAALSLIEPAIMIFMGGFVAFVLLALYLPIFSLADTFN